MFEKGHSKFEKAIIDFDSSLEKGHSLFEKGHSRFEKGHRKFFLFVKLQKPPKVGGLTMTKGCEQENETMDRKHGGPPKVGDKSPKVGGPSARSL